MSDQEEAEVSCDVCGKNPAVVTCEYCKGKHACADPGCQKMAWSIVQCNVVDVDSPDTTLFLPEHEDLEGQSFILRYANANNKVQLTHIEGPFSRWKRDTDNFKVETSRPADIPTRPPPKADFPENAKVEITLRFSYDKYENDEVKEVVNTYRVEDSVQKLALYEGISLKKAGVFIGDKSLDVLFGVDFTTMKAVEKDTPRNMEVSGSSFVRVMASVKVNGTLKFSHAGQLHIVPDLSSRRGRGDRDKDVNYVAWSVDGTMVRLTFAKFAGKLSLAHVEIGRGKRSLLREEIAITCDPSSLEQVTALVMAAEKNLADGTWDESAQRALDIVDAHRRQLEAASHLGEPVDRPSAAVNAAINELVGNVYRKRKMQEQLARGGPELAQKMVDKLAADIKALRDRMEKSKKPGRFFLRIQKNRKLRELDDLVKTINDVEMRATQEDKEAYEKILKEDVSAIRRDIRVL